MATTSNPTTLPSPPKTSAGAWFTILLGITPRELRGKIIPLLITFVAFLVTAQLGTYLYKEIGTTPALIWAPVGIAIAAVLIEGVSMWPAIALAVLVNGLINETPTIPLIGGILSNTIQPLVIYVVLKRIGFNRRLQANRDVFAIIITSLLFTTIVPTINTGFSTLYNYLYDPDRAIFWLNWWVGGALSALTLTPFLIRWVKQPLPQRSEREIVEAGFAVGLLFGASAFLFGTPYTEVFGVSLIWFQLLGLFWIAFRTGPRIMVFSLVGMVVISLVGGLFGTHPPSDSTLAERIFNIQVYDLLIATFFLVLVSVEYQRKYAAATMNLHAEDLKKAFEKIREEDAAKNEFIATLAHELRNPLASLLSSVELLAHERSLSSEGRYLTETMNGRIKTMSRLLEDLLDISRIARRDLTLYKEWVHVNELVKRAVDITKPLMLQKRQELTITIPADPQVLHADPTRIEQVLVNLLNNAAKYTPEGGSIQLRVSRKGASVYVSVKDSGVGIPKNLHERIFEPFVQARHPGKHSEGVGIGLSLTKQLVEMHGGTIRVVNNKDERGSEFSIRLPATAEPAPEAVSIPSPSPFWELRPFKILVVDDNREAAESLGKLLRLRGHKVKLAYSGRETIEMVQRDEPDILVLDIGLPDINGYEIARELQRLEKRCVSIALSGYGQTEDKQRAVEAGFAYYLTKPIGIADLEQVLLAILKQRSPAVTA